jgi:hypothetical protein
MIAIYAQVVLHDASAGNGEVNPDSECIPTGQNTTKITM